MIDARPYAAQLARPVFEHLDPWDWVEVEATRGQAAHWLEVFSDWHGAQAAFAGSWVLVANTDNPRRVGVPFAVLGVARTGQAGVGQAVLLAGDHDRFRRELARAGTLIRAGLPDFAKRIGLHRVEARCLSEHPTAARFLTHAGFVHECDMPGFGPDGDRIFRQFAWHPSQIHSSRKD